MAVFSFMIMPETKDKNCGSRPADAILFVQAPTKSMQKMASCAALGTSFAWFLSFGEMVLPGNKCGAAWQREAGPLFGRVPFPLWSTETIY